jgi:hypothetical protein
MMGQVMGVRLIDAVSSVLAGPGARARLSVCVGEREGEREEGSL